MACGAKLTGWAGAVLKPRITNAMIKSTVIAVVVAWKMPVKRRLRRWGRSDGDDEQEGRGVLRIIRDDVGQPRKSAGEVLTEDLRVDRDRRGEPDRR